MDVITALWLKKNPLITINYTKFAIIIAFKGKCLRIYSV